MRDHTSRITPTERPPRFREGVVTAYPPLQVKIGDREIHAARAARYASPTVGQRVLVLFDMGAAFVIDRIVDD